MRLQPIDRTEIPPRGTRSGGIASTFLQEFLDSGMDVVEVAVDPDEKEGRLNSFRTTLVNHIKARGLDGEVKVFSRAGRLFISHGSVSPSASNGSTADEEV